MRKHIVNGVVYSDNEWKLNQIGISVASIVFVCLFFAGIILIR